MLSEIKKIKRGLVKSVVVRTRCSENELPEVIGQSYAKIGQHMANSGAMAAGAPYVAYFNQDMNDMEVEIGIPTGMYVKDTEEIVLSEIPESEYISALYTGPYSQLKEAYRLMTEYVMDNKYEVKGAVYESYLNDPGDTPEEKLVTEILFRI